MWFHKVARSPVSTWQIGGVSNLPMQTYRRHKILPDGMWTVWNGKEGTHGQNRTPIHPEWCSNTCMHHRSPVTPITRNKSKAKYSGQWTNTLLPLSTVSNFSPANLPSSTVHAKSYYLEGLKLRAKYLQRVYVPTKQRVEITTTTTVSDKQECCQ